MGQPSLQAFASRVEALNLQSSAVLVELGSGFGDVLATIGAGHGALAVGIDLSADAVARAASRHPSHTWVVANADRIEEMDLNPVWVGAVGEGALPLDAVIIERVPA